MLRENFTNKVIVTLIVILSLSAITLADQNNWTIKSDQSGFVRSLIIKSPDTQLKIESEIEIFLDNQENPVSGRVKFNNGLERELNFPGEVLSYWNRFGGPHAFWEYISSQGKVELFNPDQSVIPQQMYGKTTRVITKDGKEYFGKLNEIYNNPDWFALQIYDRSLTIYRFNVSAVQQMK
jgi:hypothetical protein